MSDKDDGGSAFPAQPIYQSRMGSEYIAHDQGGMSLRDWYAGMALQGLLAHASGEDPHKAPSLAYVLADAMLEERKK